MSITELTDLNTVMKTLSMRRENLYRALGVHTTGSKPWGLNRREIDEINESMDMIEGRRKDILESLQSEHELIG